jgi:HSP20 family protein
VQWNPWSELARFEHAMNHLWNTNPNAAATAARHAGAAAAAKQPPVAAWQPLVDVLEDGGKITLLVDLPGVDEKDVELSIDKNVLSLRGERKSDLPDGNRRGERPFGLFARSFALPPTVDVEHIGAELKNGVLRLTLPKRAEAQPRQIKVTAA